MARLGELPEAWHPRDGAQACRATWRPAAAGPPDVVATALSGLDGG